MFGIDPAGKVWVLTGLCTLNMKSGEVKDYTVPPGTDDDNYDMETDAQGRSIMNLWRLGRSACRSQDGAVCGLLLHRHPASDRGAGEIDARGRL
jgi:hypothetical protein